MIARMGAYPSDDALWRTVTHRSDAFTKFRSAARVVIAVCRRVLFLASLARVFNFEGFVQSNLFGPMGHIHKDQLNAKLTQIQYKKINL